MLLYLVRHAKSSWAQRGISDHDRPLNDRGIRDAPRMFERLRSYGATPELIISSDAVRAAETAKLLLSSLDAEPDCLAFDAQLYHAGTDRIVAVARAIPPTIHTAALVGHNPGMTYAANLLADDLSLDNLPTCGIVGIRFDVGSWADLTTGTLSYLDYPKKADGPLVIDPANP